MEKLKNAIVWKTRWAWLQSYISLVEENRYTNQNASLDWAKSILESISKTILEDKWIEYKWDESIWNLVKKAFSKLPVFQRLSTIEWEQATKILNAFATISNAIWTFRNESWFFAHWQDLESKKFDTYLLELAISSSDLLSSFLIVCHWEDLNDRTRVYYEEYEVFNKWMDDNEEWVEVRWVPCSPSFTLFNSDIEAYKTAWIEFNADPEALTTALETDEKNSEEIIESIVKVKNILSEENLKELSRVIEKLNDTHSSIKEKLEQSWIFSAIETIKDSLKPHMKEDFKDELRDEIIQEYIDEEMGLEQFEADRER
jgi:hypothetical protein